MFTLSIYILLLFLSVAAVGFYLEMDDNPASSKVLVPRFSSTLNILGGEKDFSSIGK